MVPKPNLDISANTKLVVAKLLVNVKVEVSLYFKNKSVALIVIVGKRVSTAIVSKLLSRFLLPIVLVNLPAATLTDKVPKELTFPVMFAL